MKSSTIALPKVFPCSLLVLALFHFVAPGWRQSPAAVPPVQITTESPIVADDHCVVQRFYLTLPKGTPDGFVTLRLNGHDGGGCVYPSAKDHARRIEVNVVAMVASGHCTIHVDFLSKTRLQELTVADGAKTGDLVHLVAEGGRHPLEENIPLGNFNGDPVLLVVSPKTYRNAKSAPAGN